jgi:pimeloyl-ACP methyl ester carboxylesterase
MNLYFISGLGADKRVFRKLKLPDEFTIHHIEWASVEGNPSLEAYCKLLSEQIDQSKPFTLIGMSFGGIIAIELSKKLSPVQTIIISSFCYQKEVPKGYIILGKLRLHRLLPVSFLLKPNTMLYRIFGVDRPDEKQLLKHILQSTDPRFFRWALKQLFSWKNDYQPASFIHIHGTEDKILPYRANMNAIPVKSGGHLMVYDKAEEVSEILKDQLRC